MYAVSFRQPTYVGSYNLILINYFLSLKNLKPQHVDFKNLQTNNLQSNIKTLFPILRPFLGAPLERVHLTITY